MDNRFTRQAENALALAEDVVKDLNHGYIGTEHILLGLLAEKEGAAGKVLEEFHVEPKKLLDLIQKLIAPPAESRNVQIREKHYSPRAERVIQEALDLAEEMQEGPAGTEHLLLALLRETDCVATRLLYTLGINIQKLYSAVLTAMGYEGDLQNDNLGSGKAGSIGNGSATPVLDKYSRDLTELAAAGRLDPVIGRDKEIGRLIQILSRRTKNNPCLVGEPGVGKTAIAEGLAQRIVLGMVPDTVKEANTEVSLKKESGVL